VDIHRQTLAKKSVDFTHDVPHRFRGRYIQVPDGPSDHGNVRTFIGAHLLENPVIGGKRLSAVVGLVGFHQVDNPPDPVFDQPGHLFLYLIQIFTSRVGAGQEFSRLNPV
jgi:hypothetical protein